MTEKIEKAKRELEEAINKEFPRRGEWDIGNLLREENYVEIKILLGPQISYQNISPAWLIERIEDGYTLEMVLEHAKEANAKQERINQLNADCRNLQDLCRK